jgi:4-hydroxymandelate oxidase
MIGPAPGPSSDAAPVAAPPAGAPPADVIEYEGRARAVLPPEVWDFVAGGGGEEWTLAENRRVFDRVGLRPSVLVDVACCQLRTEVLGTPLAVPFGIAPMALQELVTPAAELATVRAAGGIGALTVVSVMASRTIEEIAAAATGPLWFQTYWLRDRVRLTELVRRAEAAGCRALVVTVDLPRAGRRRRDVRNGFVMPRGVRAANLAGGGFPPERRAAGISGQVATDFDPSATWADVAWLRRTTALPLVLKGVLTPADAHRAVAAGVDGVVVSNHGGRQLDGVPPALAALGSVADAVDGRAAVLMDGGVRTGTDVLKALALGAGAVLVGRPVLWGLAVDGERGAADVLTMLRDELDLAMALSGRPSLADVDGSLVGPADELTFPVARAHRIREAE